MHKAYVDDYKHKATFVNGTSTVWPITTTALGQVFSGYNLEPKLHTCLGLHVYKYQICIYMVNMNKMWCIIGNTHVICTNRVLWNKSRPNYHIKHKLTLSRELKCLFFTTEGLKTNLHFLWWVIMEFEAHALSDMSCDLYMAGGVPYWLLTTDTRCKILKIINPLSAMTLYRTAL
jgi:hypothetical protein